MTVRDIAALFRVQTREPPQTLEQRVARLEKRIVWLEELVDEQHFRLIETEVALERAPLGWREIIA
jgi:BMFP domain-containing protein YqiC